MILDIQSHLINMNKLKIIYRISEVGYSKVKAHYINNENCFKNAIKKFPQSEQCEWHVIADGVSNKTKELLETYLDKNNINYVDIKKGPGHPFFYMLEKMIKESDDNDILYFLENDYIHRDGANKILLEGIELGADYVTLYDHPDKYLDPSNGGNPYCEGGAEDTRVYLSKSSHWKLTNSTTGTFAGKVSSFKDDFEIFDKWTNQNHLYDFEMFIDLRNKGKSLLSPIPSYSTHGDLPTIAPLINWENEL